MQQYIYIQTRNMPGQIGRTVDLGKVKDTPENRADLMRDMHCWIERPHPESQYVICHVHGMRAKRKK